MAWAVSSSCMADADLARFVRFKSVSQACLPREFPPGFLPTVSGRATCRRVFQACAARMSHQRSLQELFTRVSHESCNSVLQEHFAREFQNSVQWGVFQGSCKSVAQNCLARLLSLPTVLRESIWQECAARVPRKSVFQKQSTRVSCKSVKFQIRRLNEKES